MKTRLIPFDIEKAKNGAKIVTRNGKPVRVGFYDVKNEDYPILCLVEEDNGRELSWGYTKNGKYHKNEDIDSPYDLFIEEEVEETDYYNPYKATVESIVDMVERYDNNGDLQDFYDNVKVKCKDAFEYDKKELHKIEEVKERCMTLEELSLWLSEKPHRQCMITTTAFVASNIGYNLSHKDDKAESYLIREDKGEWEEPLITED